MINKARSTKYNKKLQTTSIEKQKAGSCIQNTSIPEELQLHGCSQQHSQYRIFP